MLALCFAAGALVTAPLSYSHDGWRLAYRHKAAAAGHENDAPLLLVHPVGIGLSSWFWERFMEEWRGGELYAPDLIGCSYSGDRWEPAARGLFLPLDWARGCETLWREHIQRPCVVVAQGASWKDPRIFFAGYGPQASTIGANRAGRLIARQVIATLSKLQASR